MFCALNGGDLITSYIPELLGLRVLDTGNTRKLWDRLTSKKKQSLLDAMNEIAEDDINDTTLTEDTFLSMRLLQNSRRKIASEASSVWDVVVSVSLSWLSLPDWSIFPDATRVDPAAVATTR